MTYTPTPAPRTTAPALGDDAGTTPPQATRHPASPGSTDTATAACDGGGPADRVLAQAPAGTPAASTAPAPSRGTEVGLASAGLADRAHDLAPAADTPHTPGDGSAYRRQHPVPGRTPAPVPSVAVQLAAAHLRALGCHVEQAAPGRSGVLVAHAGGKRVRCEVSWGGPVGLPLGSEADVQAACGLTQVHGRRYGGPTPLGVAYASCVAGALAATGTLAALAAGGDGSPELVRTSVAQAALLAVGQYVAAATAGGEGGSGFEPGDGTEPGLSLKPEPDRALPGVGPEPDREPGPRPEPGVRPEPGLPLGPDAGGAPPFEAADGVRFELETLDPEAWLGFWTALGVDRADAGRGWRPFEQRYATAVCPLPPALRAATTRWTLADLHRAARTHGVDLTPVAAAPPPATDADTSPWLLAPAGPATVPVPPTPRPLVVLGAGPLSGVTVVEVCRRVQGPLAGHLLRLLGARVIRVEPPGGDPMRGMPPMAGGCSARFAALNHGKETLEADLATASGRAAVRELAASADVFLHSLAPGKDVRLGLDAEALAAARPGLVHAAASGWGDARGQRPPIGTDFPVQAWSGLAALVTPPGLPPAPSLLTLTDVLGGVVCAEGAVAGLLAARLTGRGGAVASSLLSAARLLCRPEFRSPDARPSVPDRADLAALATDPRFAPAFTTATAGPARPAGPAASTASRCVLVRSPWEFDR